MVHRAGMLPSDPFLILAFCTPHNAGGALAKTTDVSAVVLHRLLAASLSSPGVPLCLSAAIPCTPNLTRRTSRGYAGTFHILV